ncbi:Uncharacterised protein [Acetobacterium wieringae]|jgi:hypothetical protein|nr:Uncharacterised protein [Acetobacterium wieringae]
MNENKAPFMTLITITADLHQVNFILQKFVKNLPETV